MYFYMVFNDFYIVLYGLGRFLMIFVQFWINFWGKITKMAPIHRKLMKICADRSPDQKETFSKVENGPKSAKMTPKWPKKWTKPFYPPPPVGPSNYQSPSHGAKFWVGRNRQSPARFRFGSIRFILLVPPVPYVSVYGSLSVRNWFYIAGNWIGHNLKVALQETFHFWSFFGFFCSFFCFLGHFRP